MQLSTRFKLHNIQQTLARRGLETQGKAQQFLDNEVIRTTDKFVAMDSGKLKQSAISGSVIGSGKIVYNTPYARYIYYQKLMVGKAPKKLTNTPLKYHSGDSQRGGYWFHRAKEVHLNEWLNGVAQVIGGRVER